MSDKFNFHGNTQFINKPKDKVKITQKIYKNSPELKQKLDEMSSNLDEKQSTEINDLLDSLFQKIDESHLKANQFSDEEIKEFKEAKYSSDTKAKIKWTYPLSTIIKEVTGFSFEFEKEWKRSQEIKPDWFLRTLRKITPAHELQQTKFNEIEIEDNPQKFLKS